MDDGHCTMYIMCSNMYREPTWCVMGYSLGTFSRNTVNTFISNLIIYELRLHCYLSTSFHRLSFYATVFIYLIAVRVIGIMCYYWATKRLEYGIAEWGRGVARLANRWRRLNDTHQSCASLWYVWVLATFSYFTIPFYG